MSEHPKSPLGKFSYLQDGYQRPRTGRVGRHPSNSRRETLTGFQKYRLIFDLIYSKFHPNDEPVEIACEIKSKLKLSTVLVELRIAYRAYCENCLGHNGSTRWPLAYDFFRMQECWSNVSFSWTNNILTLTARTLNRAVVKPEVKLGSQINLATTQDVTFEDRIVQVPYSDKEALCAIACLISKRLWPHRTLVHVLDVKDVTQVQNALEHYDVAIIANEDGTIMLG